MVGTASEEATKKWAFALLRCWPVEHGSFVLQYKSVPRKNQLLRRSQGVRLIRSANETADIPLPRNPFGMAIAKHDIATIGPVIIARVREILVRTAGARIVGVIDDPDLSGAGMLADEIVSRAALRCVVHMRKRRTLGFADVDCLADEATVLPAKETGDFITGAIGAELSSARVVEKFPVIPGIPVHSVGVQRHTGVVSGG